MKNKKKIENTPEFEYFAEHYEDFMKEDEEDPELRELEIPEEWDRKFRKTMQDTLNAKWRRRKIGLAALLCILAVPVVLLIMWYYENK